MATAKPEPPERLARGRRWRRWLAGVLLLTALALAVSWPRLQARADLGAAYGARVGCTCRFIENRPLKDCRKNFEPGMGLVMLSEDSPARSVTARVPLVASQSARLRDGFGCVLQEWKP